VEAADPAAVVNLKLSRAWTAEFCHSKLSNTGKRPARVKQVILFAVEHGFPPDTPLYGESFQMLSQTAGSLGRPADLGYSEPKHYRIPQPEGAVAASGLLRLGEVTCAFTSCRRFIGRFFLRGGALEIVMDTEGLELAPGASWDLARLSHFAVISGG
jgi:alpha-galactosidase